MKFGKDRTNTNQIFSIDKTGIGEESHPFITKNNIKEPVGYLQLPLEEADPVKKKVLDIIKAQLKGESVEKLKEEPSKSKWKLDLNSIINLLNNNRKKVHRQPITAKLWSKLINWWRKDTTVDIAELASFVTIHGLLTAPCILAILTITNVDITIIELIRKSPIATILVYFIGGGSGYYLLLDINKALEETWRKKKK